MNYHNLFLKFFAVIHLLVEFSLLIHPPIQSFRDRYPGFIVVLLVSLAHPADDLNCMLELINVHQSSDHLSLGLITNSVNDLHYVRVLCPYLLVIAYLRSQVLDSLLKPSEDGIVSVSIQFNLVSSSLLDNADFLKEISEPEKALPLIFGDGQIPMDLFGCSHIKRLVHHRKAN